MRQHFVDKGFGECRALERGEATYPSCLECAEPVELPQSQFNALGQVPKKFVVKCAIENCSHHAVEDRDKAVVSRFERSDRLILGDRLTGRYQTLRCYRCRFGHWLFLPILCARDIFRAEAVLVEIKEIFSDGSRNFHDPVRTNKLQYNYSPSGLTSVIFKKRLKIGGRLGQRFFRHWCAVYQISGPLRKGVF